MLTDRRTFVSKLAVALLAATGLALALCAPGFASGPAFRIYAPVSDSVLPGERTVVELAIQNVGDRPTSGPIKFVDRLTEGVLSTIALNMHMTGRISSGAAGPASCDVKGATVICESPGPMQPGAQMLFDFSGTVSAQAQGTLTNAVEVWGGGAAAMAREETTTVIGAPGSFGFTRTAAAFLNSDGTEAEQAGADPAEFRTTLRWRTFNVTVPVLENSMPLPVEHFKNVITHLPPGLIGNPTATPTLCTPNQLAEKGPIPGIPNCPFDSQVGVAHIYLAAASYFAPLYNLEAPYGVATELGFRLFGTSILLQAEVRPGDHGIDIVSRDTSTSAPITQAEIDVWGVPTDSSHDGFRGTCLGSSYEGPTGRLCPTDAARKTFLRMPTSCSGAPLQFGAESNSYENEAVFAKSSFTGPTLAGCQVVPFSPSIEIEPTGTAADSPTGVGVRVSLPQGQSPTGLGEADLKKAVVTLPEGMALNPSAADGLQACDDAHLHLDTNVPAQCPDGSKVGTVVLHTQLIPNPIEGRMFLRPQASNDSMSGQMFRIAFELRDDAHGLDFKISGQIQANPVTGRLTTTFDGNPQLPFEDITLQFKSGARAPLVTPASCRTQTIEADLYSWAQPEVAVRRDNSFNLTAGAEGTPCPPPSPFAPGFVAGVSNVEAGAFTTFLTTFTRKDSDQNMQSVSVKMPKGLTGSLTNLPLCGEPQASQGDCGAESQIGTMTAGAGAGPTPFYVTTGRVYMTGPYKGAPFGLSIVVPAKAGPFDLGTVVVRAKVEVDVHTAQLTVTTDQLPQVVGGVPVNLRLVNVTIDRPHFVLNPTGCAPSEVTGEMAGGEGATATVSKSFQVTNCGSLKFDPKFTVSTAGRTSRALGASLDAKLSVSQRDSENLAKVKVSLPKLLPSRLQTLQKACPDQTFAADPAGCPAASRIGTAVATTPILPVPLRGPVYFVSHGGEAFPDLIVVLQGYGVTVDLVGSTFISKAGITSSTFKTVPDVPVGTFELKLPQGSQSALAANGRLCGRSLRMPTLFVAQDGAVVHRATPIAVTGCARKKAHRASHMHRSGRRR